MLAPPVVPERLPFDGCRINLFHVGELEDVANAFPLKSAHGAAQLLRLVSDHVRAKLPVRATGVPLVAKLLREIEYDGHGKDVMFVGQFDEGLSRIGLNIRSIDDGEPSA